MRTFWSLVMLLMVSCGEDKEDTEECSGAGVELVDGECQPVDAEVPDTDVETESSTETETEVDPNTTDDDGDGMSENDGDCDDTDASVYTGADDSDVDGIDQDCDGIDGPDADGDGYVDEAAGGDDCDDTDASIYIGADDIDVDGVDQNCDGIDGPDADGDGYADEAAGGNDCDDTDPTIHPGAQEDWSDGIDQDCDGYVDISSASCSADFTATFTDGEEVTLDFCSSWGMDATFEYDPDNPPELNSMTVTLNATDEEDFQCRVIIEQSGICGEGYYLQNSATETGNTYFASLDCSGVSDDNEAEINFSEGYLRLDSIDTGTQSGSFSGDPLEVGFAGHLHVWNEDGVDIEGEIVLSVEQLAGDEEENVCSVLSGDEDGDGFISDYFDEEDCDDENPNSYPGAAPNDNASACLQDNDGDDWGSESSGGTDCNDGDSSLNNDDADGDGYSTCEEDCDDDDPSVFEYCCVLTACDMSVGLGGGLGLEFVEIDVSAGDPLGRYTLTNNFYMMTTEVTQGMFEELMGYTPTHDGGWSSTYGLGANYPAYEVNWYEGAAMANELSVLEGLAECYSCTGSGNSVECEEHSSYSGQDIYNCPGYRFPTEAEWELAARSGTTSEFWTGDGADLGGTYFSSYEYSCGNEDGSVTIQDGVSNPLLSDYAWFCGNASSSMEVAQLLPNGFGLYDMHGNLSELNHDWYESSWPAQGVDPVGTSGSARVVRGGTWFNYPFSIPSARRLYYDPSVRDYGLGMRFARTFP